MGSPYASTPPGTVVQPCPRKEDKKPIYWIEIELVGEDDSAIPWEEYRVQLPNGDTARGYLDDDGWARIENIETPGACRVSFPRLDKDAWSFIESAGARRK
jgi:hypothetical protein